MTELNRDNSRTKQGSWQNETEIITEQNKVNDRIKQR